jgi:hypothetical protein
MAFHDFFKYTQLFTDMRVSIKEIAILLEKALTPSSNFSQRALHSLSDLDAHVVCLFAAA